MIMSFTLSDVITEKTEFSTFLSEFDEGFEEGHCEGWKDVKGEMTICPISPIPPLPKINQSSDSWRDGYNTGFKRGMRDAGK